MDIYKYIISVFIIAIICFIMKKVNFEISVIIRIAGVLGISFVLLLGINDCISRLSNLNINFINSKYFEIMLKATGISIISSVVSTICNDLGETSLSLGIENITKIELLIIAFPLFENLISVIIECLEI